MTALSIWVGPDWVGSDRRRQPEQSLARPRRWVADAPARRSASDVKLQGTAVVRALSAGLSRRVATSAAHPLAVREKARSTRGRWLLRDSYRALRPRRPQTATPAWPPFVVRLRGTAVGRTLPTKPNAPMASKSASGLASGMARKASWLRPGFRWPSVFRVHDGRCRLRSKPGSGALGPR